MLQSNNIRKKYPSDLTEKEWKILAPLLPSPKSTTVVGGRPSEDLRAVINGILYIVKGGIAWRMLPHDFPEWATVYGYFNRWSKSGIWQKIHSVLVKKVRQKADKNSRPTAGSIDSQSIKTTSCGGKHIGYDGGKQIKGRKRFVLVDTLGLLLSVWFVRQAYLKKRGYATLTL